MEQLHLEPAARATDPATSHRAAARVRAVGPSLTREILDSLRLHGPLTDDELCCALEVPVRRWPSVKTARSRLKKSLLVEATNFERNGQTVWQLVDIATVRVDERL